MSSMTKWATIFSREIKLALLIRTLETKLLELFSKGLLNGTVHTCVGQEFSAVFVSKYLVDDDHVVSNHRGHGHYLSRFQDVDGLLAEVMGKSSGCAGGVGGSQHLAGLNFLSNGIQGGMVPVAAGVALNMAVKNLPNVSVAFIGDGTLGEGIIYETFNIAALWNLPLLIVVENNGYAQSTSQMQSFRGNLRSRVEGFALEYFETDTWNLDSLDMTAKKAVEYVRDNRKPALLHISTYRLNSHSKGDDNRIDKEIKEYRDKDTLTQLLANSSQVRQWYDEAKLHVDSAAEKTAVLQGGSVFKSLLVENLPCDSRPMHPEFSEDRYNTRIYQALKDALERFPSAMIIGEDIEEINDYTGMPYGGAFKVTRDLSTLFKGRVRNTPISEAAITGIATGYATCQNKAVLEIMFGDFTTLIFDQILQHASKFRYMFNDKVRCPLVIRTPMGGKRGYGPTHSQSLEKYFIGIPGIGVVALHHRIDPRNIYQSIFMNYDDPFLVIENKILYTRTFTTPPIPGYTYQFSQNVFPSLKIAPSFFAAGLTVACYGEILFEVEQAVREIFEEEEFLCEIVCEVMISPVQANAVAESVIRTGNLLIVEEGTCVGAWGSEILAQLSEQGVRPKTVRRISNNHVIPADLKSEMELIPNLNTIKNTIQKFL